MKKTMNVAIGGRSFILEEDAYNALNSYLDSYRAGLEGSGNGAPEVMEEIEMRIADLFRERMRGREVVDLATVRGVIAQLGMPDWKAEGLGGNFSQDTGKSRQDTGHDAAGTPVKKFYRNLDGNMLGGVCSGIAVYFNIDVVIVRIIFVVALLMGTAGFWIYLVICIIAPAARTATEKCELRGIPPTEENLRMFSGGKSRK